MSAAPASPRPVALFLSPHLDDAAFSAGGVAARLAAAGRRVVIATAFTASVPAPAGFALACQTAKGIPADVDYMALRRAEDAAACAALGAEPLWLGLPEAPHRGYGSAAALFGPERPSDPARAALAPVLAALDRRLAPEFVFCCEGIGGHVDHLLLRDVAGGVTGWSRRLLHWRDQPYARRTDTAPAPGSAAIGIGPALAAKQAATRAYVSQLGFQFGGAEAAAATVAAAAVADGDGRPAERVSGPVDAVLAAIGENVHA